MTNTGARGRSRWARASLGLAIGGLVAGCGADATGDDGDAVAAAEGSAPPVVDGDAFCDALLAISSDQGPDVDFETASEEEIGAAFEAYAAGFLPKLRALETAAPDEVGEAVAVYTGTYEAVLETGDDSAFDGAFIDAEREVVNAAIDTCADDVLDLVALDYTYEGVTPTVSPGRIGLRLDNQGEEVHEAVVYRRLEGATADADDLFELTEEERASELEFVGVAFVDTGSEGVALVALEPGDYVVACLVAVGTTTIDAEIDGPLHTSRGMLAEFTVG